MKERYFGEIYLLFGRIYVLSARNVQDEVKSAVDVNKCMYKYISLG